tara:strand:+ start:491 stop:1096 length:606 start_codon:yes stop_codon:yes gene_type:complete
MKKYILFQSLIFFLLQCDSNPDLTISDNQCVDLNCQKNINNFLLKIVANMQPYDNQNLEQISDTENYLGVHFNATDDYDSEYDILESPNGPGNWVSLYFPHNEWNHPLGDNFTKDIKSNVFQYGDSRLAEWTFVIESNIYGTIDLSFQTIDEYCYDCIKSIQLMSEDGNYFTNDMNMDNISVSRFIQQNQLLSFNLVIEFN